MTNTAATRTYTIVADDLADFEKKYRRIARKFEKLGRAVPAYSIGSKRTVNGTYIVDGDDYPCIVSVIDVTFGEGDISRQKLYGDYEFVGSASYLEDGESFVSFTRDSEDDEFSIRSLVKEPTHCDHCGIKRKRNKVYILRNIETGNYMQVGNSCMKDLFGIGIADAISEFFGFVDAIDEFDEDNISSSVGQANPAVNTIVFLAKCVSLFNSGERWISKKEAFETNKKSSVEIILYGNDFCVEISNSDIEIANEVIHFVNSLDANSEYIENLQQVLSQENISYKLAGIAGSAVPMFYRNPKKAKDAEAKETRWYGNVDDKIEFTGTVLVAARFEGHYGSSIVLVVGTDAGEVFKTTYTGRSDAIWALAVGDTCTLTGTVKDHTEYNGDKQTVLTRVKVK